MNLDLPLAAQHQGVLRLQRIQRGKVGVALVGLPDGYQRIGRTQHGHAGMQTEAQIAQGLTTEQVNLGLTTAQIASLTTTQIAALEIADIVALTGSQTAAFTSTQIGVMTNDQLSALFL